MRPSRAPWGYFFAHAQLAACVAEVSWAMAAVMFAGLATFGSAVLIGRKNQYGRRK